MYRKQLLMNKAEGWDELAAQHNWWGFAEHSSQMALLPPVAQIASAEPPVYLYSIALLSTPTQPCLLVKVEMGQEVSRKRKSRPSLVNTIAAPVWK